eukprot:403451_1
MEVRIIVPTPDGESIFNHKSDCRYVCLRDLIPNFWKQFHQCRIYNYLNWDVYMQPITTTSTPINRKQILNELGGLQPLCLIMVPKNMDAASNASSGGFLVQLFNVDEIFQCLKIRANKLPKTQAIRVNKHRILKVKNTRKSYYPSICYDKITDIDINEKNKTEFTIDYHDTSIMDYVHVDDFDNLKSVTYRMDFNSSNIRNNLKISCKQQNNLLITGYVRSMEKQCDVNIPEAIQDTIGTYAKYVVVEEKFNREKCKHCVDKIKYIQTIRQLSPQFTDT